MQAPEQNPAQMQSLNVRIALFFLQKTDVAASEGCDFDWVSAGKSYPIVPTFAYKKSRTSVEFTLRNDVQHGETVA
jgi:hypothetical protein